MDNKNLLGEEEINKTNKGSRFIEWISIVSVALVAIILCVSLYKTTVIDNDLYSRAASDDQWKLLSYSAHRGVIYDCNLNQLASNTYDYTVVCSPSVVAASSSFSEERTRYLEEIASILGMTYDDLDAIIPINPNDESDERNLVLGCDIKKNVPLEVKETLEAYVSENSIYGIGFVPVPQRYYNYGSLASQVLGYASNNGEALRGVVGLESYYNSTLSGVDGYRYSEVDSRTEGVLPYQDATQVDPIDGNNLVLNIDMNIQRIAEEAARDAYQKYTPYDGVTVIVMDPYTGAVLAMVSLPDYDLNDPYGIPYNMDPTLWASMSEAEQIEYLQSSVWRNRAISDTYEPGSTFKALTTCIALEENLTNINEQFSDAPIDLGDGSSISCWLQKQSNYNHGTESLLEAFENSCNPVFAQLAIRIGITRYYEYVHTFGFYELTGIDLPAEGTGIFHSDPSWIDMACLSYGESATVTPIQLLNSYCAIINGGNLMVPHVVKSVLDSEGNIIDEIEPEVIRTVFSEQTCSIVRGLMEAVVTDGTGSAGKVPGYSVAGKTSTSTIETGELAGTHVLSFSCYAPSNDPKIAVLVIVNKPTDHLVGSSSAASTAARIVEGTLTYMGVERIFTEDEYNEMTIRYYVQPAVGLTCSEASSRIGTNGITTVYGSSLMNSNTIVGFTYPSTDATLYSTGIVMLYPEGTTFQDMITSTVPNLSGKTAMECVEALRDCYLNVSIEGDISGICVSQSIENGMQVPAGEIITVTLESPEDITPEPSPTTSGEEYGEDGIAQTEPTTSNNEQEEE